MATAGELITKLAAMAGISKEDPSVAELISNAEFNAFKVSDELSGKLSTSLMNIDAARNNETLRKHFHAEILNGLDDNLKNMAERFQLDPTVLEELNQEKKTTDKYAKLVEKLQDLNVKKANAVSKSDKKEVEMEIQTLNNQIRDLQTKLQQAPAERDQFWSEKLRGKAIQNLLSSYNYTGEKDIPKEVLMETAQVLLNKKLNEQKIRVEYNPEQDNISLKTESGLDFYKDNTPVSFKSFVDSVLSESKLLNIQGASAPIQPAAQPASPKTIVNGSGKSVDASKFYAAFEDVVNGK